MSGIMNMLVAAKTTIAAAIDAYFNNTTLLLNTSSTNGAQNNTFLDSSTNNFTITRNGNTTQGTFTPFSQTGWSNFFDGSSNLQTPSTSAFNVGTGNFTFEAWIFPTAITANTLFFVAYGGGGSNGIGIGFQSTGLWGIVQAGIAWGLTSSTLPTVNQWNHVVACRGGTGTNQTALFLNGTRIATGTYSTNFSATSTYGIGWDGSNTKFSGYMSNLRFNTTDVYGYTNSTITVPTTNLSAITGTAILTCQSNRFLDNSTNAFSLTINGTPSVQAFSPFAPTAAYSTSVVGGSGYFDGTSDYLSLSSTSLNLGANDFTIEMWVYATTTARDFVIGSIRNADGVGSWMIMFNDSQPIRFFCRYNGGTVLDYQVGSGTFPINTWTHLAVTRSGANLRVFQNGTQVGTTNTTLSTFSIDNAITNYYVASSSDPSEFYTGYLSGTRLLVGTALYTTTFTPPTAPPTAITNTTLLLNYTNAGIYDSTAKNVLETVGNAQVSTTQAKWGTTSMYFDGTGDYLTSVSKPVFDLGKGDWTIEFWINPTAPSVAAGIMTRINFAGNTGWGILYYPNYVTFVIGSGSPSIQSATNSITAGSWQHVAITRSGTSGKIFINGTQSGSTGTINDFTDASTLLGIGALSTVTGWNGDYYLTGYIDDLRITKGYARYTTTFTPPTAAFPLQ